MGVLIANNAATRLASSLSSGATAFSVTAGDGAKFPAPAGGDWFPVTVIKPTGEMEIMRCTGRSGDMLTVQRAQENTSATAFTVGDRVELRLTAGAMASIRADIDAAKSSADASVKKAGDVMTGALTAPSVTVGSNAAGSNGFIDFRAQGGHSATDARIYVNGVESSAAAAGRIVIQAAKGLEVGGPLKSSGVASTAGVSAYDGLVSMGTGSITLTAPTADHNLVLSFVSNTASMRGQLYVDQGGILRYTRAFVEKFRVQDDGIVSHGVVYSGNGTGFLATDGNVYGTIWGGFLSNYLSSYFLQIGNLPTANANIGLGGIGSYAFLGNISGTNAFEGNVFNGTGLRYYSTSAQGSQPPGNWRCHGICPNGQISVWQRVS